MSGEIRHVRWDDGVAANLRAIAGTTTSAFTRGTPLNFWFRLTWVDFWWMNLFSQDRQFRTMLMNSEAAP